MTPFRQIFNKSRQPEDLRYIDFINYMITLKFELMHRHGGVMACTIEDKTAVVVVASYHRASRTPVRFKALDLAAFDDTAKPAGDSSTTLIKKHDYHFSKSKSNESLVRPFSPLMLGEQGTPNPEPLLKCQLHALKWRTGTITPQQVTNSQSEIKFSFYQSA